VVSGDVLYLEGKLGDDLPVYLMETVMRTIIEGTEDG
jgi:hypothetical protein